MLANLEDVVYLYRPNREADFLHELLKDFKGVLVTDFYGGYDSLPCHQQKCLIHLIRDFNNDLKGNPYDEEFKALAAEFGKLLRSIVGTIDKYGLKKHHLHKHKADVTASSVPWRPASTAPSWRRATRSGSSRTRANSSRSSTTMGSVEQQPRRARNQGVRVLPRDLRRSDERGGAVRLPRPAERLPDLQVPWRQLPQVPALARGRCGSLLPARPREEELPGLEIYPEGFAPSGRRVRRPHGGTKDDAQ